MEIIYIMIIVVIAVLIAIINEEVRKRFCKDCGTRMELFYDIEEDAEVYQCPNCGRCYLR